MRACGEIGEVRWPEGSPAPPQGVSVRLNGKIAANRGRAGGKAMNIQGQFASDDERAARRLVEQAGTILKGPRGDMPESFAPLMYAGASAEDLVRYEARELADMAEAAWLFLQERKPGASKIR